MSCVSTRAAEGIIGNNGLRMVAYTLHREGPQQDPSRDVVGVRARLYSGSFSYVNFVSIVSPASEVHRLLPDDNEELLHTLLAQVAVPHLQAALASKRLPLADPTMSFEIRVPARALLEMRKAEGRPPDWSEPLTLDVVAPPEVMPKVVRPRRLHVRNLLSFNGAGSGLDIDALTVLVGPNGAGKSNLLRAFRLLRDLFTRNMHISQRHRPFDSKPLGFDLEFEVDLAKGRYTVDFELADGAALVLEERLEVRGEILLLRTSARDVVYRSVVQHSGGATTVDIAHQIAPDTTALGMIGREAISPVASSLRQMIDEVSIQSMFSRRSEVNGVGGDQFFMNADGSNTLGVITRLLKSGSTSDALIQTFAEAVGPGADLKLVGGSWRAVVHGQEFAYEELSNGTQKWLQLMAMLIDPLRPALLLIDEPENGLHPDLLFRFAIHAVEASRTSPIVLCTHSTNLLDHLHLGGMERSVRVVENIDGSTTIRSIESELELEDVKEMLLGTAWASGLLGGNPL